MNTRQSSSTLISHEEAAIEVSKNKHTNESSDIQADSLDERSKSRHFEATMNSLRRSMSTPQRLFSTLIHSKPIAVSCDLIGGTLARPNALLLGAVFAFIGTLGAYLLSKNLGYSLSGFETIGAFIIGWIAGLVYDYLKLMVTGKN